MKRILCLLIAVMLAVPCCVCAADESQKTFSPEKTGLLGYSADTWVSSLANRSMLTVFLILDFASGTGYDVEKIDFESGIYVIKFTEDILGLFIRCTDGSTLMLMYVPKASLASYEARNDVTVAASEWRASVERMTDYTTYFVPADAIYEVITKLSEILNQ